MAHLLSVQVILKRKNLKARRILKSATGRFTYKKNTKQQKTKTLSENFSDKLLAGRHFGKEAIITYKVERILVSEFLLPRKDRHVSGFSTRIWGNAEACSKLPSASTSRSQILARGQGDKHSLTWRSVRHCGAFRNCPGSALPPPSLQKTGGKRQLLTQSATPQVRLCLCHLDSERVQPTERKKKIENTCLKGRNTPPREGMQQREPKAHG